MNEKQVEELFKIIKVHYPTFQTSTYAAIEWQETLKDYEYLLVLSKWKNYQELNLDAPPRVQTLVDGLSKKNEKHFDTNFKTSCQHCKRLMDYKYLKQHEDRCLSIRYLRTMITKYFLNELSNFESKVGNYYKISNDEFNEIYNKILKKLLERELTEKERDGINNYFNPPTE